MTDEFPPTTPATPPMPPVATPLPDPAEVAATGAKKPTVTTWILSGAGCAVIAVAAIIGIKAVSGSDDNTVNTAGATQNPANGQINQNGYGGGRVGRFFGGGAVGTISSIDGTKITLADPNGGTTEVVTRDSTTFTD